MSLYTGKRKNEYIWEEFTIDDGLIQRIDELAKIDKIPLLIENNTLFEWSRGLGIE